MENLYSKMSSAVPSLYCAAAQATPNPAAWARRFDENHEDRGRKFRSGEGVGSAVVAADLVVNKFVVARESPVGSCGFRVVLRDDLNIVAIAADDTGGAIEATLLEKTPGIAVVASRNMNNLSIGRCCDV